MKATGRALIGVVITALAPIAYLQWWARSVRFGELTWPWWLAIALGVLIAGHAALRPPPAAARADRFVARLCFVLALGLAGLCAVQLRAANYALPDPTWSRLELGRELPDVTLVAADGREFNLLKESREGSLKGRKLLLSFFRGHW